MDLRNLPGEATELSGPRLARRFSVVVNRAEWLDVDELVVDPAGRSGAITLYTQQPARVGDFCRIGTETGTIEEIGLRTTRVRTLANTVIAIPNARLANEPIDNISARRMILFRPILRLRYDTTPEQLQQILDDLRNLLTSHERILQENHRVRLKEIADDALLIEVFAYLDTTVWTEYLELAEELNLRILKIVSQAGTTLSPPARTLQIEQSGDSG